MIKFQTTMKPRLESLDILRGLDLFILVFFQPVFMRLAYAQPDGHLLRLLKMIENLWHELYSSIHAI